MTTRRLVTVGVVLAGAVVGNAAAGESIIPTITVAGRIVSISADSGRVAVDVESTRAGKRCEQVEVWHPPAKASTPLAGPFCRSSDSTDTPVDSLTLAGGRAVWVAYSYGNHAYCDGPFTATLGSRKVTNLSSPDCDGTSGDIYWQFAGRGSLLAARKYLQCEADCAPDYSDTYQTSVTLYTVGTRLTSLGPLRRDTQLLAVDAGRILLGHGGELEVVRPHHGSAALEITMPAGFSTTPGSNGSAPVAAFLAGPDVVAVHGRSVAEFDAATGAAKARRTLRAGKGRRVVRGLSAGVLLYSVGTTLHLLRLADGRDVSVQSVPGLVDAKLDPDGLSYGYDAGGAGGRVAFLSHATLARLLA